MTEIRRRTVLKGALSAVAMACVARSARGQSQKQVKFLLDVLRNPKHALFYPAWEQGYFAEQGLKVVVEAGKGSADVIQNIASGAAQFGFADASAVVLARSRGLPVTLVTMVHYKTLMTIITRVPSGIDKPVDLVGKKIATTSGDAVRTMMPAFATMNGFDGEKVSFLTVSQSAKASMLMAGQVDGVCDYLSALPIYQEAGDAIDLKLKAISYADYGLDVYSNGIIVHEDLLRSDPAMVKSFVHAIVQGLNFASSDPGAAIKEFRADQPQYSEKVVREGLRIATDALLVPEVFKGGLGAMSLDKIERTIGTTVKAYGISVAPAASAVYTNAMVPGIYPKKA